MVTALRENGRLAALALPLLVAIAVIVNGWSGLLPGVDFWDTGEFQVIGPVMGTGHAPGFPTFAILGWIINILLTPLGEPAFRMNVFSLLCVALAAAGLVVIVRSAAVPGPIAAIAAFGMATTPLIWLQATRTESHTLHLAFVALIFVVLLAWERDRRSEVEAGATGRRSDRWLLLGAVLFGVSGGNHGLTFILFPAIGLFVLAVDPPMLRRVRFILGCGLLAFGALAAVYLELPIRAGLIPAPLVYGTPNTWDGFWYVALATQFHGLVSDPLRDLGPKLSQLLKLATDELGVLTIFVPIGFVATVRRAPGYAVLSGSAMLITLFWNSFFNDGEISRYYLTPLFWAWTWLAILGAFVAEAVADVLAAPRAAGTGTADTRSTGTSDGRRRQVELALAMVVAVALILPSAADWQRRASAADRSQNRSAQQWLKEVMPVFAQDAVVVSWWSASTPLWYAQFVDGLRPDIYVVDDRTMLDRNFGRAPDVIRRFLGQRPVYALRAIQPDLEELQRQFVMVPVAGGGNLTVYLVTGELPAS
jgi:hypothetical protein